MNALPALCAVAILSASSASAEPLNPDETQFVGWRHAISEMEDRPIRYHSQPIPNFAQQLARINREINSYHFNDAFEAYWEKPSEFRRYGGQCRDYAVAKYARLYDLGVADTDMELTVVRLRSAGRYHAMLVVRHMGRVHVLDNLRGDVQGPKRLRDFHLGRCAGA